MYAQTVAPRRESLARATELYLQRRASGTDTAAPEAGQPATSATLSANPSMSRRCSNDDEPSERLTQQPGSGNTTPKLVKYKSDGGYGAAPADARNSPTALADCPAATVSPALTPHARALSKELSWELQSQQLPPKQSPYNRTALFHSPQQRTSSSNGNPNRQRSDSNSGKLSKANSASLAAMFEAAAAGAEEVEGSRVCIVSRNASENGSRAGSRIPSFKWQQPTPQNTPEKTSSKNGK